MEAILIYPESAEQLKTNKIHMRDDRTSVYLLIRILEQYLKGRYI